MWEGFGEGQGSNLRHWVGPTTRGGPDRTAMRRERSCPGRSGAVRDGVIGQWEGGYREWPGWVAGGVPRPAGSTVQVLQDLADDGGVDAGADAQGGTAMTSK